MLETDALFACRVQPDESVWVRGSKAWTLFSASRRSLTERHGGRLLKPRWRCANPCARSRSWVWRACSLAYASRNPACDVVLHLGNGLGAHLSEGDRPGRRPSVS